MDNNYNNQPDNGQDNTYSGNGDSAGNTKNQQEQQYTDPNAGYSYGGSQGQGGYYSQNGQTQYQDQSQYQYQNYNYSQNYNQQYGGNGGYNPQQYGGMDTSPMSMGDWVLTILRFRNGEDLATILSVLHNAGYFDYSQNKKQIIITAKPD